MTVASVDYENKRIYLDASTMTGDLDTLDVYRDVRELRRTTEDHRKYYPIIIGGGGLTKTSVKFTPSYVKLLYGCRIVPYDSSHMLKVIRETFTDDGYEGRDCFDRSSLSPSVEVDVDYDVDKVEIRVVATGGSALTTTEHDMLFSLASEERLIDLMFRRSVTYTGEKISTILAGGDKTITLTYDSGGKPTLQVVS